MARSWTSTFDVGRVLQSQREGATAGLEAAAQHVFSVAQRDVPLIKGDLSRSGAAGTVSPTRAAITYTGKRAVSAHERTDIAPANGRSRKWLERAMNSESRRAGEIIADTIRGRIGS